MSVASSDARIFFTRTLPRVIVSRIEQFAAMTGSIAVTVRKQGAWTVRFGDLASPVTDGADEGAELALWFSPKAFTGFVDGTLDVVSAVQATEVAFDGDLTMLEKFGHLLDGAKNAVSARFSR